MSKDEPAPGRGRPEATERAGGLRAGAAATDRALSIVEQAEEMAKSILAEAEDRGDASLRQAEAEAWQILRAARREADSFLLERRRRLTDLAENLTRRAETALTGLSDVEDAQSRLSQLVEELHDTSERLLEDGRRQAVAAAPHGPAGLPGARDTHAPAPASPHEPVAQSTGDRGLAQTEPAAGAERTEEEAEGRGPGRPAGDRRGEGFDAALQVAAQMAIAGGTRGEIADHLKRAFGLQDPHWILNDVFGEGGGPR